MRQPSAKHTDRHHWRRRVVALAVAYAVALSSLLASFGAARADAADATAGPLGVICHHDRAGQPTPLSGHSNSNICIDCCCVGCLMPMAALPPPPATTAPLLRAISYRVGPVAMIALSGARTAKSHRSRAPPSDA